MTKVTCDKCGKELSEVWNVHIIGNSHFTRVIVSVDLDLCRSCVDQLGLCVAPKKEDGACVERLAELLALVVQEEVAAQIDEG